MTKARRLGAVLLGVALLAGAAAPSPAQPAPDAGPTGDWLFVVTLDGKPIGEHRFTVTGQGSQREVRSVARFEVKILGATVYRYRHDARERWRDGCLAALQARTDDDGKLSEVQAERVGDADSAALLLQGPAGSGELAGCVMTFAYWYPAMQRQSRLLNPQTGRYEPVAMAAAGGGTVAVRGQPVEARRLRLTGPKDPIDLWLSPSGDWLGLDSQVGRRLLSYRLKAVEVGAQQPAAAKP